MREEITNVSYTQRWLQRARAELAESPGSVLHHYTHPNYLGGVSGWEDYIDSVYFSPQTLAERLLQMQVHEVMVTVLENAFRKAEGKEYDGTWTVRKGMDLSEAYRVSHMVARVDPLMACKAKLRLNRVAQLMGTTLFVLGECNFQAFVGPADIHW